MSDERTPPEFTPQESALIERLRNAPQKRLSPRTHSAIHAHMLAEFATPSTIPTAVATGGGLLSPIVVLGVGLMVIVVIVLAVVAFSGQPDAPIDPIVVATETPVPSETPAPSETPTPSETPIPSETPTPSETPAPSETPVPSETPTPSETPVPSETPTPSETPAEMTLVIEGAVQAIDEVSIIIHGLRIAVSAEALAEIQIGDILRIEGEMQADTGVIRIRALAIAPLDQLASPTRVPGTSEGAGIPNTSGEDYDCNNPPPSWAPAYGWRARCEGAQPPGGMGNPGMGNGGMGMGR